MNGNNNKRTRGRGKAGAREVQAQDRELRALELRKAGKSYREIGEELGIHASNAYRAVDRALKRLNEEVKEEAAEMRRLDLERLDTAINAIWQKVTSGDLYAIDRLLSILDRRSRYLGLDAPERREGEVIHRFPGVEEALAKVYGDRG